MHEELYKEMGRMLHEHPEAAHDPVLDTRCHNSVDFYRPEWEVAKIVLHEPGEEDGYVTLEME